MQKIGYMKLTRLTVTGFKCFANMTSFDLNDITYITGDNHVGKSSIADAIAFAFTGKLYSGDSTMDRLYNEESNRLQITVAFTDEHDARHALIRTRADDVMSINYDGYEIRQKDINAIFGESDVFLSILNPTFFIERLGGDGQKLLQKYLPLVSHEAVLGKLTDYQHTLLEHQSMISPETFIKNLREKNRDFGESIIALEGQKALLQTQKRDGKKELSSQETKISEIDVLIGTLRQKQSDGINVKDLEEKRLELLQRRDELLSDKPIKSPTAQLDLNIQRAQVDLDADSKKQYSSKYAAEITKLEAELKADSDAYRRTRAVFENIRPGVTCPTCLRAIIDIENVEEIKTKLNQSLQDMMQLGMAKRAQLTELLDLDKQSEAVFEQFKNEDLEKQRKRIAQLMERRNAILSQPQEHEGSLSELNKQIADVENDLAFGGLSVDERERLADLEMERMKLASAHDALKTLMEQPTPHIEKQKKELEDSIKQNDKLIAAALDYLGVRNDLTFQNLPLNKVAFSLFDIAKTTGEVKNTFRFTYDGRDYRKLSHSEKIFAGMEVSELIKALTGRNYPVFVDDSESVVSLARIPTGQVLLSRVIPKQQLTVAGQGYQPEELPKAS